MFRLTSICILFLLYLPAKSQDFSISVGSGIGTYQMKDLKNLNNSILLSFPVKARIVNNFPVTPTYSAKALIHLKKLEAGLNYSFNSTGSRIHYADYSGEISAIQVVTSHQGSVLIYPVMYSKGKHELAALFRNSILFNRYSLNQDLTVWDESVSDRFELISKSLALSGGLAYSIKIRPVEIRAEAEYLYDFGGPLYMKGYPDFKLYDNYDEKIKTNFSGWRIGLFVGWYF